MMQDTILLLCKESVREILRFMVKFIPKETFIHSTSVVKNEFHKEVAADQEDLEEQEDLS